MDSAVAAAVAGDEAAFGALVEPHRRELQVHCYRMLGSYHESEDMVQEAFLRAWRSRATFAGRSTFRAWLYRIATNACLDHLERHPRRPVPVPGQPGQSEVPWLEPFPDALLDQAAPEAEEPAAVVVARETIELAFLVAVQHLPPRQRAVLLLRDVLGWRATEAAELLGSSVTSVNSSLQRARATLRERLPQRRAEWSAAPDGASEEERAALQRFIEASERADVAALGALLRDDVIFSMPPEPGWMQGRDTLMAAWGPAMVGPSALGEFRLLPARANRSPAAANYVRSPGKDRFEALSLDVLRVVDGEIVEVTTFDATLFPLFGLPATL
ncbi:RNA polymerase subunit sigma-70 [Pseudonocardia sp. CNS-139]|nr:RNA polymerase subunit sigma-70 [Pseudonocardia sp. CNS-139]